MLMGVGRTSLIKGMIMAFVLSVFIMDGVSAQQQTGKEASAISNGIPKFEIAVELVKKFEGLHDSDDYPYYGYGHCRLPGENLSYDMTEKEAEMLLRKDLKVRYSLFRKYGKDALLLTVLSYNVGQGVLLGHGGHPKSRLIRKLEAGDRNIYEDYVSYCHYKGRKIRSIERRRKMEYLLLYEP